MTSPLDEVRCAVLPGDGIVGRWPGGLIVVVGGPVLLDRFFDGIDASGLEPLVERARTIDWAGKGGGYLAVIDRMDGLAVEGGGDCDLVLRDRRLSAADAPAAVADPSLIEAVLDRRRTVPTVGSDLPVALDGALGLERGLVPGAGVRLISTWRAPSLPTPAIAEPPSPPIAPPTKAHAIVTEQPSLPDGTQIDASVRSARTFEVFTITEPLENEPAPLPMVSESFGRATEEPAELRQQVVVQGIMCPNDHFNHPRSRICVTCGTSTDEASLELVRGFRPILGYLVLDDGTSYQLNQNYIIGRLAIADEGFVPISLDDDGISRRHARIELHGWDVALIDGDSMNGTRYQTPDSELWSEATAGRPVVLQPGSRVDLGGRRTFTFEAVYRIDAQ